MPGKPRPLVAGNWKMNGLAASRAELDKIVAGSADLQSRVDLLICPPAILIANFAAAVAGSKIQIGAQDCHAEPAGAFTGDISAEMLADAGAKAVIVGHSERRAYHKETDEEVRAKVLAAHRARLVAILCIGETRMEREAGATIPRLERQLNGSLPDVFDAGDLVIAYEPVWAIGTGLTPSLNDVAEVHRFVREQLVRRNKTAGPSVRILYGGSVKPENAADLLSVENVNGALVGGASLKAQDFLRIATAA